MDIQTIVVIDMMTAEREVRMRVIRNILVVVDDTTNEETKVRATMTTNAATNAEEIQKVGTTIVVIDTKRRIAGIAITAKREVTTNPMVVLLARRIKREDVATTMTKIHIAVSATNVTEKIMLERKKKWIKKIKRRKRKRANIGRIIARKNTNCQKNLTKTHYIPCQILSWGIPPKLSSTQKKIIFPFINNFGFICIERKGLLLMT